MTLLVLLTVSLLGTFAVVWRQSVSPVPGQITTADSSTRADEWVAWSGSGSRSDFPILALLEGGLTCQPGTLTQAVNAAHLEQRASLLMSEYMGEASLLTGLIPRRVFDRIIAELLPDQAIPSDLVAITELMAVDTAEMHFIQAA